MIMTKTFLSNSGISGIGMFAGCNITKDSVIWKYDPRTTIEWSDAEWETLKGSLPELAFENIARFTYLHNDKWLLNLDDSRFMNHSNEPNMGYDLINETCFALRDICEGEELTIRYQDFCEEGDPDYYIGTSEN